MLTRRSNINRTFGEHVQRFASVWDILVSLYVFSFQSAKMCNSNLTRQNTMYIIYIEPNLSIVIANNILFSLHLNKIYYVMDKCGKRVETVIGRHRCKDDPALNHHWVNTLCLPSDFPKGTWLSFTSISSDDNDSENNTLNQCWFNAGPASAALGQH